MPNKNDGNRYFYAQSYIEKKNVKGFYGDVILDMEPIKAIIIQLVGLSFWFY